LKIEILTICWTRKPSGVTDPVLLSSRTAFFKALLRKALRARQRAQIATDIETGAD